VFNVLGDVEQFKRELINERAREGIIKAKARGVKFGRSKKANAAMVSTIYLMRIHGLEANQSLPRSI